MTHRVVIKGGKLLEVYRSVAAGVAVVLKEGRMASRKFSIRVSQPLEADEKKESLSIRSIQIKGVAPDH